MILGSVASIAVGIFVKDSMTPITVILLSSSTLALLILTVGKKNIKKVGESVADVPNLH